MYLIRSIFLSSRSVSKNGVYIIENQTKISRSKEQTLGKNITDLIRLSKLSPLKHCNVNHL